LRRLTDSSRAVGTPAFIAGTSSPALGVVSNTKPGVPGRCHVSDNGRFFQFPLCALAFGETERDRLEAIISFGFVDAGNKMFKKLDTDIRQQKAKEFCANFEKPDDYSQKNTWHVAAMLGAQEIGITVGNLGWSIERWRILAQFRDQFATKHGPDVEVRIRKDLVFETRDNKGITYREFAILCAVYSFIGSAAYPVRIIKEAIQTRMLGYKKREIMETEVAARNDKVQPLTLRQIGYTLNALHKRKFFARARANERQTYYSHRLTQEELEEELFKRKTGDAYFHAARKTRDKTLMERIKAERRRLAVLVT
jgi:hypothetical protein